MYRIVVKTIRKKTSYYISIFLIIAFITLLPSVNDVCQISKTINAVIVHWNTEASRVYKQPSLLATYEMLLRLYLYLAGSLPSFPHLLWHPSNRQ